MFCFFVSISVSISYAHIERHMARNQLTKRRRRKQTRHSVKRRGRGLLKSLGLSRKGRRYFSKSNPLNGVFSMVSYWKDIENQLRQLKHFRCVFCRRDLNINHFKYKSVMHPSRTEETTPENIIVRKYNLASAIRDMPNIDTTSFTGGGAKQSGGVLFQPTIFYFHCPYCAFLHQFKSSVKLHGNAHQHDRKSSRSFYSSRSAHSARSSRSFHSHSPRRSQ